MVSDCERPEGAARTGIRGGCKLSGPTHVAITGLRTFLGQRLAERLASGPRRLRVVGLDIRRPYRLEGRIRFQRVDLTDPVAGSRLAEIFEREKIEAVVHAAFRRDPTPDLEYDHELETVGTLHVLHACAASGVRKLVLASSTMLYGPHPDNPNFLSESHPLRGHPQAHCVRNRIEAEQLARDWNARHPEVELSVLRPCWIMGPRYWDRVVRYFARPWVPVVLGYDPLVQFVHEEDCLHAFEVAVRERRPGVYNVVGSGVLPLSTVLRLAGKQAIRLPPALLRRLAAAAWWEPSGDPPAAFYDYLRYLWVADGTRGWEAFGEPVYSSREAWIAFVSARRLRRYR